VDRTSADILVWSCLSDKGNGISVLASSKTQTYNDRGPAIWPLIILASPSCPNAHRDAVVMFPPPLYVQVPYQVAHEVRDAGVTDKAFIFYELWPFCGVAPTERRKLGLPHHFHKVANCFPEGPKEPSEGATLNPPLWIRNRRCSRMGCRSFS
jgi:hypothetical protein